MIFFQVVDKAWRWLWRPVALNRHTSNHPTNFFVYHNVVAIMKLRSDPFPIGAGFTVPQKVELFFSSHYHLSSFHISRKACGLTMMEPSSEKNRARFSTVTLIKSSNSCTDFSTRHMTSRFLLMWQTRSSVSFGTAAAASATRPHFSVEPDKVAVRTQPRQNTSLKPTYNHTSLSFPPDFLQIFIKYTNRERIFHFMYSNIQKICNKVHDNLVPRSIISKGVAIKCCINNWLSNWNQRCLSQKNPVFIKHWCATRLNLGYVFFLFVFWQSIQMT